MIAAAPAKVILSGEHAVVYGAPALAVAVRCYAHCRATALPQAGQLQLQLLDLKLERILPPSELAELLAACRQRHQAYRAGQLTVAQIVTPLELLLCAIAAWLEEHPAALQQGVSLAVSSEIPVGAGMGSSAAVCASVLAALSAFCGQPLAGESLQRAVTAAEQWQHGRSSGLDPALSVNGGLLQFQRGISRSLTACLPGHWWLVHSGTPTVSTGACVEQVRQGFAGQQALWAQFTATTTALAGALECADLDAVTDALRRNHRLLQQIGVVPAPVARFIQAVEAGGGAAKISGAGAVAGAAGGLILVYHPRHALLPPLPAGYRLSHMELDADGTRVRD